MRRCHQALGDILLWVIATHDFLTFEQGLGAMFHIPFVDRRRRSHGVVGITQGDGIKVGIGTHTSGIGRLTEIKIIVSAAVPRTNTNLHQAVLAFLDDKKLAEDSEAFNHHLLTVGDDFHPMRHFGLFDGCPHDLVVLRTIGIGLDIEMLLVMVDAIQHVGLTLLKHTELISGLAALEDAAFRRQRRIRVDNQIFP